MERPILFSFLTKADGPVDVVSDRVLGTSLEDQLKQTLLSNHCAGRPTAVKEIGVSLETPLPRNRAHDSKLVQNLLSNHRAGHPTPIEVVRDRVPGTALEDHVALHLKAEREQTLLSNHRAGRPSPVPQVA